MQRHAHLLMVRFLVVLVGVSLVVAGCGSVAPSASPAVSGGPSGSEPAGSPPACPPAPAETGAEPWWADRVFYEVFVRSFRDADGDGIGDLRGLTERLDYLNDGDPTTTDDLGVTGIWLMPVAESPSYHGYDVVDYRTVEADYGTNDDFRALVAAAHDRGIAVIVDFVINHTSRDHPWFAESRSGDGPRADWYLWADDRPAVARGDGSRVWHPDGDRFYYGYFWEGMPDLNLGSDAVTAELDAIADLWLGDLGADGFRIDAARHLFEDGRELENRPETFDWLEGFRERIHDRHPDALVLGEVWDASSMSARYVRDGALDLTFDFSLASGTITSLTSGSAGSLRAAQREAAELYPPGGLATFLTNHDQNRVASELDGDVAAQRLAATILLTGSGTPFVYYGEEIGLAGSKPDERIRTPMRWDDGEPAAGFSSAPPWQALGDDPPGTDVATQAADPDSLLSAYRELIALRAAEPALATGTLVPIRTDDRSVAAWLRHGAGSTFLVVVNVAGEAVPGPVLELASGPLCGAPVPTVVRGEGPVAAPSVTPAGGFEEYRPVDGLDAHEAVVVRLADG